MGEELIRLNSSEFKNPTSGHSAEKKTNQRLNGLKMSFKVIIFLLLKKDVLTFFLQNYL